MTPIDPSLVRPVAEQVAETAQINARLRSETKRLLVKVFRVKCQLDRERARRRYLARKAWRLRQELRDAEAELRRYT